MNRKMIANTLGVIIMLEGAILLLPAITGLVFGETKEALSFIAVACGAAVIGFLIKWFTRKCDRTIFAREGFVITALAWTVLSLIGAVPFVLTGDIPSYVDALFEFVSGLTTTGASILTNVEAVTHAGMFWRCFSHWIGGMGVLVLMMAILPDSEGRSIHIMRAEMPGPVVDKIVPRVRGTAKTLYMIYIALTLAEFVFLLFGRLPVFEALMYAIGTAGTGGFGLFADSLAGKTPYVQWVITAFMLLFSVNFNMYFLLLIKKWKSVLKSEELRTFICIVLIAGGIITFNIRSLYPTFGDSVRHAFFQVATIASTSGYSSTDFNLWPGLSKGILFILMFVGGCAGSTAGGFKLSRIIMLFKMIKSELHRMLHPRSVTTVKFEGKSLDSTVKTSVSTYLAIYIMFIAVIFLLICGEPFDMISNFSATIACFNNVGPGFGAVGPMAGYSEYSNYAKIVLSAAMLLGRLEIYPILLSFAPGRGIKRK